MVLTPQEFDTKYVESLEESLRTGVDPTVHLVAQTVLSTAMDRNGPVFQSEKERSRRTQMAAQTQFISRATQVLTSQLQVVPGARLLEGRRDFENEQSVRRAVVRTPQAITPAHVRRMQEAVQVPVYLSLIVRSVVGTDATASGYLSALDSAQLLPTGTDAGSSLP